jgi:hypothetical protein
MAHAKIAAAGTVAALDRCRDMGSPANQPEPVLTTGADAPMTAEQVALLRRLAHEAFDFEAFSEHLTQGEAVRRIATLQAKLALQGEPPHTQ